MADESSRTSNGRAWWDVYGGAVWASATLVIFVIGVVFRYFYIYKIHNPNDYVYSDMKMYVDLARRLNQPEYKLNIGDITHPPGNTWLLQYFMRSDPTKLSGLVRLNFIVASLVPLSMGFLGWVAYPAKKVSDASTSALNRILRAISRERTAQAAIIFGSVYFPYIDFGGYYLAEIHMTLVATLCIALYLLAMRLIADPEREPEVAPPTSAAKDYRTAKAKDETPEARSGFFDPLFEALRDRKARLFGAILCAVVGGFLFSFAMALKMVAMLAIGGFVATHFFFAKKPRWIFKFILPALFILAALPLTKVMVTRCTQANVEPGQTEGRFCTGSNKSAADFLLGHKGRIQGIEWRDPKVPGVVGFGNPAAYQHGYREKAVVPFLITNQEENNKAAWDWIRKNRGEALVLSFEHVWDAFGGSYPWPPNATKIWPFSYAFHFLFLVFVLFPALVRLTDVLRDRGVVGLLRSDEFILLSPIFGVCAAVFLATGEVRYRIPWDPVFFLLAIEFYRNIKYRFSEPKPVAAEPSAAADGGPSWPAESAPEGAWGGAPKPSPTEDEAPKSAPTKPVDAKDTSDEEGDEEDDHDDDDDDSKDAKKDPKDG